MGKASGSRIECIRGSTSDYRPTRVEQTTAMGAVHLVNAHRCPTQALRSNCILEGRPVVRQSDTSCYMSPACGLHFRHEPVSGIGLYRDVWIAAIA